MTRGAAVLAVEAKITDAVTMELRKVSAGCEGGDCPTVYLTDRGTAVFQGETVAGARIGQGEQAVELPLSVVRSALAALQEESQQ